MDKSSVQLPEHTNHIIELRGTNVVLDLHLAKMYGIETRALKQQVKRNRNRFPPDFMFELTGNEINWLVSQFVIPDKKVLGGSFPMAFTEQGVAMLSSVLRSEKALEVNIAIMRTFVQIRRMMSGNLQLEHQINSMEKKYDERFKVVFTVIKQLIDKKSEPRREVGFRINEK